MTLVLIPRFSIMFIVAVGVVIITGPTLMWFLESDVGLITESVYGKLILVKISIAAIMVGLGAYFKFKIQKKAEKDLQPGSIAVYKKLKRSLKFDVILGIILLGVVALLANGTLPAGEIKQADAQKVSYDFSTIEFSENTKFDIKIAPFSSGANTILVKISNFENKPLYDSDQIKVKISNPQRNIFPIEIPMKIIKQEENRPVEFQGDLTFGFSGQWQVEIETQRDQNANESIFINLLVKPRLTDLKTEIIEYELPESSKPLYPLYDGKNSIWVSDPSSPRLWQFLLDTQEFTSYSFDGLTTMLLTQDNQGKIWFTESASGKIEFINPKNNDIIEFTPEKPLASPEALVFDDAGNLWIAEHTGMAITKFDPILETFERISVPDQEALPYGMSFDRYGNIWIPQHTIDKIAAYDPYNKNLIEITIPTATSFVQFSTSDNKDNVWFVEQQGNKLAMIKITEIPITISQIPEADDFQLKYTEIASPLIAMGIIATSLFFVKSLKDKRRLNELIMSG